MNTELFLDHEGTPDGGAYIVRALLRVTGDAPEEDGRVPLNLSIVLDRSGSMSGEKLARAREAAALLVRRLRPEDVVSVVAYDDQVVTVAEPATGREQEGLAERIRGIASGGYTNLSGGWLRGRELVAAGIREGGANRVLLLTDGLANVGITDPDRLVGLCRKAREQGIATTTIGFGTDYDEELLRFMAEAGGGGTYYIEHADQAPAVFAEEIEGLLSLSAQNLSIEVRPAASARLALVHHRYPSRQVEGGVRLDLGDLYARDPRRLLAEFLLPTPAPAAEADVATFVVTADVLTPGGGIERREIRLPVRASLADGPRVDPEVRRELLLQQAARARYEAREAQERGDFDASARLLSMAADHLAEAGEADPTLAEEAEELHHLSDLFTSREAGAAEAKYLYQTSYAATTSRPASARSIRRTRRPGKGGTPAEEPQARPEAPEPLSREPEEATPPTDTP